MRPELLNYFSGKPAAAYLTGIEANHALEEGIEDLFNLSLDRHECSTVSGDWYDNSLEVYIHGIKPDVFKITPEQAAEILSWGCSRFWISLGGQDDGEKSQWTHEIPVWQKDGQVQIGALREKHR